MISLRTFLTWAFQKELMLVNTMSTVFSNQTTMKKKKKTIVTRIPYYSLKWAWANQPPKYHNIWMEQSMLLSCGGIYKETKSIILHSHNFNRAFGLILIQNLSLR